MKEKLMRFTIITALVLFTLFATAFTEKPVANTISTSVNQITVLDTTEYGLLVSRERTFNDSFPCYSTKSKLHLQQEVKVDTAETVKKENLRDSLKRKLIQEVNKHIRRVTTHANDYLGEYLVNNALEHNIKLCFMMAQTEIETCYGVAGAGRETSRRSLFGVIKRHYNSYDKAIDDWCRLVKKSYMGSKKTEEDLMRNYVTLGGYRYCENGGKYERELRSTYDKIRRSTQIDELEKQLRGLQS